MMIGWIISAFVTKALLLLASLIGVYRVVWVKNNNIYCLLAILCLPLVAEMILTLKRRNGQDYKCFSPAIFFLLISIVPSIWTLELHHRQWNKTNDSNYSSLASSEDIHLLKKLISSIPNGTEDLLQRLESLMSLPADEWILALHQTLLILLILGKWFIPRDVGVSRDQPSQLLIFVGTAADILEFTSETLSDVNNKIPNMVYIILGVWTISLVQFPFNLSVGTDKSDEYTDKVEGPSPLVRLRSEIWSMAGSLFFQDGPFLVTRLIIILYFNIIHQKLIFFTIKNLLVIILNVYRMCVICIYNKQGRLNARAYIS